MYVKVRRRQTSWIDVLTNDELLEQYNLDVKEQVSELSFGDWLQEKQNAIEKHAYVTELADDGYQWGGHEFPKIGFIDNEVHKQGSISRIDEVHFKTIICDERYFIPIKKGKVETNDRYYLLCHRCGYIPSDKLDLNSKFLDAHCKCGNPVTYAEFTAEEIYNMIMEYTKPDMGYYGRDIE